MNYLVDWSKSIFSRFSNLGDFNPSQSKNLHPNARQPKCALRHRPSEIEQARDFLQTAAKSHRPEIGIEVSFRTGVDLITAFQEFPSIKICLFLCEEYVSFVIIRITDDSVIDRLIEKDWFLAVPNPTLTFGNPADQSNE